jgi:hypothetical protein
LEIHKNEFGRTKLFKYKKIPLNNQTFINKFSEGFKEFYDKIKSTKDISKSNFNKNFSETMGFYGIYKIPSKIKKNFIIFIINILR